MLALLGRRPPQGPRCTAELDGLAHQLLASELRVFDRSCDADMADLRIGEDLVDFVDRPAGDAGAIENLDPFRRRFRARNCFDDAVELIAMLEAVNVPSEVVPVTSTVSLTAALDAPMY